KQLHISRSPELGGGVSDYPTGENILCGIDSYEICQASFPLNTQVTLDASPNEGYEFSHWEINDLAMADVDGSIPVTMSENKDVIAVFVPVLKFPLSGTLESRELAHFFFSDTWDCAQCGQCPTGTYKLHVGADLSATYNYQNEVGERVDAAHAGVVKKIFTDQHLTWADAIVIESDDGQFTTVYWHVIKYGNLAENDPVTKGQQIATIADLGDNTHFHFGIRMAPYSYPESLAGALPVADGCGYLAFPEKFIDPKAAIYE
ncbi:MAG: peptidoglycan DD-metalloendopeptidase family protein, partial [Candidatus Moranbacteria bacterium]|nr:peptidoglycan DD-metalloendopeptidase family protein [Candidatus Moranbacteria bacterium]